MNFRNTSELKIEGCVKINGSLVKSVQDISSIAGYVQQEDLFVGCLTVKEHLTFQAMLRMDKTASKLDKIARVQEVLHDV